MIYSDVKFGIVDADNIEINRLELCARIGDLARCDGQTLEAYISACKKAITYRYAYTVVPLKLEGDICDFGFARVNSTSLSSVLKGANKAIILAVSAGMELDRLISRSYIQRVSDAFLIDGIGSAAIESFADHINKMICEGLDTTKRFSPGYSDFPLEFQTDLLERLSAPKTVGITLTDKLTMIPMKSITAVIGVK